MVMKKSMGHFMKKIYERIIDKTTMITISS